MEKPTALLIGGTGTIGASIAQALSQTGGFNVLATTRRNNAHFPQGIEPVVVDVLDQDALKATLDRVPPITHVFYAALYSNPTKPGTTEFQELRKQMRQASRLASVPLVRQQIIKGAAFASNAITANQENERMLENVLTVVEQAPHRLEHVGLVTGGKIYGMHLTPYLYKEWQTPMREDTPPAPGPNFYHYQEQRVIDGAAEYGYSYTISRPSYVVGYAESAGFNVLRAIAIYGALLKEQGLPLIFPGDEASAKAVFSWCDAEQIAALHLWAQGSSTAQNQVFNISNGDPRSFEEMWPVIADALDMEPQYREEGFEATALFNQGRQQWPAIVSKYDLQDVAFDKLISGGELANLMAHDWDTAYDLSRLRQAGFDRAVDSAEMFTRWITRLREIRVIP